MCLLLTRCLWLVFVAFALLGLVGGSADLARVIYAEFLPVYCQVREYEGKDTALLVDRYRFLDLFPCSKQELRSVTLSPLSGSPSPYRPTSSKYRSHKPEPTLHSAVVLI